MVRHSSSVITGIVATAAISVTAPIPRVTAQCQPAKLTASDAAEGQHFGWSVSIDSDYAVVGGVGVAYVFHRSGTQWIEQARLDGIGPWVAIGAERIVIGNTDDDEAAPSAGAAFVFRREGTNWIQEGKLVASDAAPQEAFGRSVAITGDVIVVGDTADDDNRGSGYVFRWNGMQWVEEQKLIASDAQPNDYFGLSVSVSGDAILVGTAQSVFRGPDAQAYVFRLNGGVWIEEQRLVPSQLAPKEEFGGAVGINGNIALVGAPALGTDEDPGGPGSAFVYQYDGLTWVEQAKLTVGDYDFPPDLFGVSVAITENVLVVGASQADQADVTGAGTAYLFQRVGPTWIERAKLTPSDPEPGDFFGSAVAVTAKYALVGAQLDDDACPSDPQCNSGSAYVFSLAECGVTDPIPAVSGWGLVVMVLLVFAAGAIVIARRRRQAGAGVRCAQEARARNAR